MRQILLPSTLTVALAVSGCGGSTGGGALPQQAGISKSAQRVLRTPLGATSVVPAALGANVQSSMCAKPTNAARAGCFATVRTDSTLSSAFTDAVNGLTPRDLSSLYAYPAPGSQGSAGAGQIVAVVVAGDYGLAESDLAIYRSHFGLPPCTTANGCFTKVGAAATNLASTIATLTSISAHPTTASAIGWAAETDADTQMVSAVCPQCHIVVAEAASDSLADLTRAGGAAVSANASIINASFGATETSGDTQYSWSNAMNSRHVKMIAAAGDWGYGVYYPASDSNVIAVGGTSLAVNGSTVSETAWSGTGSGCSSTFNNPGWQRPPMTWNVCTKRNVADISAIADPNTGVAVYDSSLYGSTGGWAIFGGTSIAAPIISGMYGLSGDSARGQGAQTLYSADPSAFLPVTSGSNGICNPQYLCTAGRGYNGPTGLGVPQGLGGF